MAIVRFSLAIQLCFLLSTAHADDGSTSDSSMLGGSNQLANSTSQGAVDNHNGAENQFSNAHHHHHMAHSGGGPSMMAKALGEAQQAMQMQNQAQQMARAALDSMKSANQQVDQNASGYNADDVALLNQIATSQSQLSQEVQAEFAADGYNVASNSGTLAAPTDTSALTAGQGGSSTTSTTVIRGPASTGGGTTYVPQGTVGATGVSGVAGQGAQAGDPTAKTALNAGTNSGGGGATGAAGMPGASGSSEKIVADQRQLLALHRAQVMGQLGQGGRAGGNELDENGQPIPKSPIRPKQENIFEVVHTHYQSLRGGGRFFEANLPAEDVKTRAGLPEFSKGF